MGARTPDKDLSVASFQASMSNPDSIDIDMLDLELDMRTLDTLFPQFSGEYANTPLSDDQDYIKPDPNSPSQGLTSLDGGPICSQEGPIAIQEEGPGTYTEVLPEVIDRHDGPDGAGVSKVQGFDSKCLDLKGLDSKDLDSKDLYSSGLDSKGFDSKTNRVLTNVAGSIDQQAISTSDQKLVQMSMLFHCKYLWFKNNVMGNIM